MPDDPAPDPDQHKPGSFGCHEALHMANVCAKLVEAELSEHPAILANLEWSCLADRATAALQQLYQAIGKEHL